MFTILTCQLMAYFLMCAESEHKVQFDEKYTSLYKDKTTPDHGVVT